MVQVWIYIACAVGIGLNTNYCFRNGWSATLTPRGLRFRRQGESLWLSWEELEARCLEKREGGGTRVEMSNLERDLLRFLPDRTSPTWEELDLQHAIPARTDLRDALRHYLSQPEDRPELADRTRTRRRRALLREAREVPRSEPPPDRLPP